MKIPMPETGPDQARVQDFLLNGGELVSYTVQHQGRRVGVLMYDAATVEITGKRRDLLSQLLPEVEPELPPEQGVHPEPLIPPVPPVKIAEGALGTGPSRSDGWHGPMPENQP